jgi:cytochrome c-type biogenesis protein CcmH
MILTLVLLFVTAIVLAAVLAPLWQRSASKAARGHYDRAIYRDQLKEIERDVARGIVQPADADQARREIERRILATGDEPDTLPPSAPKPRLAIILAAAAVVGVFAIYVLFGAPDLPDQPFAHRAVPPQHDTAQIQGMVASLAARLQQQPGDFDGWVMLGRSYSVLGDNAKAADAYEHARALKPGDATVAMNEAAALLADSKPEDPIPARVVGLLKSVEKSQPDQPMALWFLGMAAAQQRDFSTARRYWRHLLEVIPADAPERKSVNDALAALEGK